MKFRRVQANKGMQPKRQKGSAGRQSPLRRRENGEEAKEQDRPSIQISNSRKHCIPCLNPRASCVQHKRTKARHAAGDISAQISNRQETGHSHLNWSFFWCWNPRATCGQHKRTKARHIAGDISAQISNKQKTASIPAFEIWSISSLESCTPRVSPATA